MRLNTHFSTILLLIAFLFGGDICQINAKVGTWRHCATRYVDACIQVVESRNDAVFSFLSPFDHEITLTVTLSSENTATEVSFPFTTVIPNSGQHKLFVLKRNDVSRRWKYSYKHRWNWGSFEAIHNDEYAYSLPFAVGSSHKIMQGLYGNFSHQPPVEFAIDFAMKEGTTIHAAREGIVIAVRKGASEGGNDPNLKGRGNAIFIRHDDATVATYAHLKLGGVFAVPGQRIWRGDSIGKSGCTGYCSSPHLHFEVRNPVDGYSRQTIQVRFRTDKGTLSNLRRKASYRAVR